MNEAQTRREIIDKRLAKAGWDVKDPSMVTEELDIISDINRAADPQDKYSGHLFSAFLQVLWYLLLAPTRTLNQNPLVNFHVEKSGSCCAIII
ncbi:MAG: hypothetical protein J7K53_08155 [Bacteroidales bacterium]|nr:hypothetical protein [Bacteroidales bacterium]